MSQAKQWSTDHSNKNKRLVETYKTSRCSKTLCRVRRSSPHHQPVQKARSSHSLSQQRSMCPHENQVWIASRIVRTSDYLVLRLQVSEHLTVHRHYTRYLSREPQLPWKLGRPGQAQICPCCRICRPALHVNGLRFQAISDEFVRANNIL